MKKGFYFYCILLLLFPWTTFALISTHPSKWMTELYSRTGMRETRLMDIAIPGTHNSGTYGISFLSKLEPGESFLYVLLRPIVASWSRCQFRSVGQQLRDGIRYLDLRVAYNRKGVPLVVHGLVSVPLQTVVSEVKRFVRSNPQEVVLIEANLSWGYRNSISSNVLQSGESEQEARKGQLKSFLRTQFQDLLLDYSPNLTFARFWDEGKSVLLLEPDSGQIQNYWPNSYNLEYVRSYLDSTLRAIAPGSSSFRNHSLIFTPSSSPSFYFMPKNLVVLFGNQNALSQLSLPLRKAFPSMIHEWESGGYHVNIVSTDFYEKFSFVHDVLRLNGASVGSQVALDDQVFQ